MLRDWCQNIQAVIGLGLCVVVESRKLFLDLERTSSDGCRSCDNAAWRFMFTRLAGGLD